MYNNWNQSDYTVNSLQEPTVYGYLNALPSEWEYERWLSVSRESPLMYEETATTFPLLLCAPQMGRSITIQALSSTAQINLSSVPMTAAGAAGNVPGTTLTLNQGDVFFVEPSYTGAIYLISGDARIFHGKP
jgi:hypothetical protein